MAAVVGVPDLERGQVVKAFIRLASGAPPPEGLVAELQRFVKDRVGFHAYPRSIEFVADLPLTTTGKLQRFVLRERTGRPGRSSDASR
jgi:acetyl-CoA synthetase